MRSSSRGVRSISGSKCDNPLNIYCLRVPLSAHRDLDCDPFQTAAMASHEPTTIPHPTQNHVDRGYGASTPGQSQLLGASAVTDYGSLSGNPIDSSPLSQSMAQQNTYGKFNEEWDASQRGSSVIDGGIHRSNSGMSQGETLTPSRGGTLKKKASLKRGNSLKKSSSRRSSRAGSVRSLALQSSNDNDEMHSAFFSPVPFNGNPTETLANRFQGMVNA